MIDPYEKLTPYDLPPNFTNNFVKYKQLLSTLNVSSLYKILDAAYFSFLVLKDSDFNEFLEEVTGVLDISMKDMEILRKDFEYVKERSDTDDPEIVIDLMNH